MPYEILRTILVAALFGLCSACSPSTQRFSNAQPYFKADTLPATLLSAPLRPGAPGFDAELTAVRSAQRNISATDMAELKAEEHVHLEMMTDGLSTPVARATHPRLFAWLDRVSATSRVVVDQDKKYWNNPRPYAAAPDIARHVHSLSNASYPSGHTTFVYLMADTLGQYRPGDAMSLAARAERQAAHRVMAGVHYPQDLRAGKELAGLIANQLNASPEYRRDRDAAIEEGR